MYLYKKFFYQDTEGKKLNINSSDKEMGNTTINVGIIDYKKEGFKFSYDIRRPKSLSEKNLFISLKKFTDQNNLELKIDHNQELIYHDPKSDLSLLLLNSYKDVTRKPAIPFAIGGGTYARSFPNSMAFGPTFPKNFMIGDPNIHGPNENISKETIILAYEIYYKVLKNLKK